MSNLASPKRWEHQWHSRSAWSTESLRCWNWWFDVNLKKSEMLITIRRWCICKRFPSLANFVTTAAIAFQTLAKISLLERDSPLTKLTSKRKQHFIIMKHFRRPWTWFKWPLHKSFPLFRKCRDFSNCYKCLNIDYRGTCRHTQVVVAKKY